MLVFLFFFCPCTGALPSQVGPQIVFLIRCKAPERGDVCYDAKVPRRDAITTLCAFRWKRRQMPLDLNGVSEFKWKLPNLVCNKNLVNNNTKINPATNTSFLLSLKCTPFPFALLFLAQWLTPNREIKCWLWAAPERNRECNHYSPIILAMEAVLIIFPYPCFNITRPAT